jgi:Cd2+/Zn2+-exporting ATPase
VVVAIEGRIIGAIAVADKLRPDVNECLRSLKKLGIVQTIMLTGDHEKVAAATAHQAGMDSFYANLLPQDKLVLIQNLIDQYGQVGMVGDGVNDAPALAAATVGIALGGSTTDVALETADVVMMAENLSKLPFAVGLGRATRAIIWQNLVLALTVIMGLVLFSLTPFANIGVAILFHEGSTLLVVLNALRLLGYHPTGVV